MESAPMRELLRSTDLVHLSWARATLEADGIDCVILDEHVSGIEGGINAFPRRVMVEDEMFERAKTLLQHAEAKLNGV
jgi:hypothetical protein